MATNAAIELWTIGEAAAILSNSPRTEAHFGPFSTGSRIGGTCNGSESSTSTLAIEDCGGGEGETGGSASVDSTRSCMMCPGAPKSQRSGR